MSRRILNYMFNWLNFINRKFSPYPHQLANAERILKHDAVYIFDEVGTGKTFSAAAMTLEYLENQYYKYIEQNKNDDGFEFCALVISPVKEQFANDWIKYFNFIDVSLHNELTLTTSYLNTGHYISKVHNISIKFVTPGKISYGNISFDKDLLIIDEAHMFLNDGTQRTKVLKNYYEKPFFKSSKVVFMTATPCKHNVEDLNQYTSLADSILKTSKSNSASKLKCNIDTVSSLSTDLNCTRLFKNIVDGLNVDDWYDASSLPHRQIHIWDYNGTTRNEALVKNLCKLIENHRFIIFVRYVKVEAEALGTYLKKHLSIDESDICVVTGKNKDELFEYSGEFPTKNPKILILTYQIADKGVNLQSFDYVINYHISALPSCLEQRFGRIDRPRIKPQDVHMCYLVNRDNSSNIQNMDRYSKNFYIAAVSSMNIIQSLPCRNAIFTLEILSEAHHQTKILRSYIEQLIMGLKDSSLELKLKKQIEYILKNNFEILSDCTEQIDSYMDFIHTDEFSIKEDDDVNKFIDNIIRKLKDELDSLKYKFPSQTHLTQAQKFLDSIKQLEKDNTWFLPDRILYFDSCDIQNVSVSISASECINKIRTELNNTYNTFKKLYDTHRKGIPISNVVPNTNNNFACFHTYLLHIFKDIDTIKALEKEFEDAFSDESDFIFSQNCENLWITKLMTVIDDSYPYGYPYNRVKAYDQYILNMLYRNIPLLNLFSIFKNKLLSCISKKRFNSDPFQKSYEAFLETYKKKRETYPLNLISDKFNIPASYDKSMFTFRCCENKVVAAPWYKLAFILVSCCCKHATNSGFSCFFRNTSDQERSYVCGTLLTRLPDDFTVDMLQGSDVCTKEMVYATNPNLNLI